MSGHDDFDFGSANERQREAITAAQGSVLIIAGPGTGKTFTLVKRISYLILKKGVKPSEILVTTFTAKAGRELLTRISDEFLEKGIRANVNEMYIGTFHSVCLRLLKENLPDCVQDKKTRLLDAFEQTYFVYRNIEQFSGFAGFKEHIKETDGWRQALAVCRYVNLLTEETVDVKAMMNDADEDMRFLGKLVNRYRELADRNGYTDFSSLQALTLDMLQSRPDILQKLNEKIKYIMVDEYQDTNHIQERLIFTLAGENKNICVVGDDDQGMYRFRGATIRNILEFPSAFAEGECRKIYLETNYRSVPGIIDVCGRWINDTDNVTLFNWGKCRFPKTIRPADAAKNPPSVFSCMADSAEEESERLYRTVKGLLDNGNITDLNQVAFLCRSVKSTEALCVAAYLESRGMPVFSPRAGMFFEREEVKLLIGCFLRCFKSYLLKLQKNGFSKPISDELRRYYIDCFKCAGKYAESSPQLKTYTDELFRYFSELKEDSGMTLQDVFYRLIAFPPFRTYLDNTDTDNVINTRAARNLSEISRILSRFAFLHDIHTVTGSNKETVPEEFFNSYLKSLYLDGVGEYEDEAEYAPHGCLSFMTVHQAKGLEFPVTVVLSLGNGPRRAADTLLMSAESRFFRRRFFEPPEDIKHFDFKRLYYTAFSRARDLLILASKKSDCRYFSYLTDSLPPVEELYRSDVFSTVKKINFKRIYSFTSHISVYDGCPTQYKFYKEYRFAQRKMFHTSLGSLVHATLEDINKCAISGNQDEITEERITEWFALNARGMRESTGYVLTEEQSADALTQVLRYYRHRKNDLGKVWKAEEEIELILPGFILQGVIDLVEGRGDTVEIVDYKTGPKPDVVSHPERVAHYKKQLEIYAYLIEKRYGKKVSRLHLYYTSATDGEPLVSFEREASSVENTILELTETVKNIENKNFRDRAREPYACAWCDMKYYCGQAEKEE